MEIRKSLEANFLTCRICTKAFTDPKVLSCMHTFCKPCLEHVLQQETLEAARKRRELEQQRSSGYSSGSSVSHYKGRWSNAFRSSEKAYEANRFSEDIIQCPICSKRTTLPMAGVHGLPDDQLAGKLASIVGRIPNYPVCDVCSSGQHSMYPEIQFAALENPHPHHQHQRPWTDAEDGDTSDVQSTEEEERADNPGKISKPSFGLRRRYYRNGQKKRATCNASDDEIFAPTSNARSAVVEANEAVAACLECGKRLCNFCLHNHTKLAVTANHVIVSLDQLTQMFCARHPREMKRFFCLTCGELICLVCTFESSITGLISETEEIENSTSAQARGHADHDVLSIREGLTNLGQCIKKSIFDCRQKAERLELLLLGIKSCISSVNSIKDAITSFADDMVKSITTQKEALLGELDADVGISSEQLGSACENILTSLGSWAEMKQQEEDMEAIYGLHPVDALREAGLLRARYYSVLGILAASLPRHSKWPELIKEIDSLEQKFGEHVCVENGTSSETGKSETNIETVISNSPKVSEKRVRFVPPVEAAGKIPASYGAHWARRLGTFIPGDAVNLGRRVTQGQLAAEAFEKRQRFVCRAVQASPTDVHGKPLPAERDARRHRAIQADLQQTTLQDEVGVQTEPFQVSFSSVQRIKVDSGTQFQSSDINTPVSFFRSSKQITVQK